MLPNSEVIVNGSAGGDTITVEGSGVTSALTIHANGGKDSVTRSWRGKEAHAVHDGTGTDILDVPDDLSDDDLQDG